MVFSMRLAAVGIRSIAIIKKLNYDVIIKSTNHIKSSPLSAYQFRREFASISNDNENLSKSNGLPIITLYTHNQCSLCDDLVEELEGKFNGQYRLEKVDIKKKENLKFLRLYRLDIPVCFLNGEFLCKHKLDGELLEKRLREINSSK